MPRKVALEALSPVQQKVHDLQFRALVEGMADEPNPSIDLSRDTLKTRRLALGLRSTQVASALKIAESSLRNYESGVHEPGLKVEVWQKLMALYRVDTEELFVLIANTTAAKKGGAAPAAV